MLLKEVEEVSALVGLWELLKARKYRRLFCRICVILFITLLMIVLTGFTIFDQQHNNILHDYVAREDDLVILHSTLYTDSKSFPDNNTVVVLMNAHQVFHLKYPQLKMRSENATHSVTTMFRVHQVVGQVPFYCKWVPYLAIGQVAEGMTSLSIGRDTSPTHIHVRRPYTDKHSVVTCFTPMFLFERWQLLFTSAEVYTQYGSFMHFYIRSMTSDVYHLLKSYRNARITSWPSIQLDERRASGKGFNPNMELEFRNQASAMTDCLLMYKDAADYIIFPDIDDVLVPRMGDSYKEEFDKLFYAYPVAAVLAYNMTQTRVRSAASPDLFSPTAVLRSVQFVNESRWGKLVVRPELVNSVWIHQSYGIRDGYEQQTVPLEKNSLLHLRFWDIDDIHSSQEVEDIPYYDPMGLGWTETRLFNQEASEKIEKRFNRWTRRRMDVYSKLPRISIYYPLIEQCYNRIFYNGQQHGSCKGPELCQVPKFPGIRCVNANATFTVSREFSNLYVHKLVDEQMTRSSDGCKL